MEILISAFVLGLMGSFHCIGMCGPIALSLPLRGINIWQKTTGGLFYNIGRTITYGVMGAFFGLIGQGFHLLGFQQLISVAMGSFMILSVSLPWLFKNRLRGNLEFFTSPLRHAIQRLFKMRSYQGLFLIGLLNGLLPCGLVYLAIAGAIGTGNFYYGIAFMILFGLGTLPMMLAISWAGNLFSIAIRNKINKVVPFLIVIIGALFILRGLTLGIPMLSPPAQKMTPAFHINKSVPAKAAEAVRHSCCQPDSIVK
jgi:sulfite exporter TauE/SafE